MTGPLDALRHLTDTAARMIDWLQGHDEPDPFEELGGAITRAREVIATAALREWHPAHVKGYEQRWDEHGNRHVRSAPKGQK